jgi:hypothetical protein
MIEPMLTPRIMERTTRTPDGHLLWTGGLANGRPATKHEGRTTYVKRLVWEEVNGPIPEGTVVTSSCGECTCIEPAHLVLRAPGRHAGRKDQRGKFAREPGVGETGR